MKPLFNFIGALALGAGAMYYLDPQRGRRRRARVGDRLHRASTDARHYFESQRRQMSNRVRGLYAKVRGRFHQEPVSDQQLEARIRARLGRVVSFPHAIATQVREGCLILRGDILESEFNRLMAELWSQSGVRAIESQLALHAEAGNVPALQGEPHRIQDAKLHHWLRNAATSLALIGGLGTGYRALRIRKMGVQVGEHAGGHRGLLSLAFGLLAFGVGDGTQRLARRRRLHRVQPSARMSSRPAAEGRGQEDMPRERPIQETPMPALTNPSAVWH